MAFRTLGTACLAVALFSSAAQAAVVSASVRYGVEILSITGPNADSDLEFVISGAPQYSTSTSGSATATADAQSSNGGFPASPFESSAEIAVKAMPSAGPSSASAGATNEVFLYIENYSQMDSYEIELNFFYGYSFSLGAPLTPMGMSLVQGFVTEGGPDPAPPEICGSDFNFNYDTADAPFSKAESGNCVMTELLGPATPDDPSFYSFYTNMSAYGEADEAAIPVPAGVIGLASGLASLAGLGAYRQRRRTLQQA